MYIVIYSILMKHIPIYIDIYIYQCLVIERLSRLYIYMKMFKYEKTQSLQRMIIFMV